MRHLLADARRLVELLDLAPVTLVGHHRIWGRERPRPAADADTGLSERVPRLRVEILRRAGHWVPYERAEVVNALIREFVD
jgi:hypothetical protein